MGWRNDSFRGFADYMQTPEFARHLGALIEEATHDRIALLCAQAVPWRCHRSLIADALPVHGIRTEEIINATRLQVHKLTSFARVNGVVISTVGSAPEPKAQDRTKLGPLPGRAACINSYRQAALAVDLGSLA